MDNLELLKSTVLFRGSSKEELELVNGLFQERLIKPNTTIFTEKMHSESLYVIKSGSVRITMMVGEGEEKSLLLLGQGEFFGELALIQEADRQVTARVEEPTEILVMTRKDFQALMDLDPRTASRLLMMITKLLAARIKAYTEKLKVVLLS